MSQAFVSEKHNPGLGNETYTAHGEDSNLPVANIARLFQCFFNAYTCRLGKEVSHMSDNIAVCEGNGNVFDQLVWCLRQRFIEQV